MGRIFFEGEGEKTLKFGEALFTLDSGWSKYEEGFQRSYQLDQAGFGVRRTELLDSEGKLSGRGVPTMIYLIWVRRGRVEKTRGRKPKSKGKFGVKKPRIGHKVVSGAKNPKYNARRNVRANAVEKGRKLR